jgi:hypothetical protein
LRLAQAAKSFNALNFVRACLLKVILEIEIANFTKNTVKEIIYGEEALKLAGIHFNASGVKRLQEKGVLFIKGISAEGKTAGYAALYKGEVIAQGTAKEVREGLKDLWTTKGAKLIEELDKIINRRRIVSLKNVELLGQAPKSGVKMLFTLIDEMGNNIGQLSRAPNGKELVYKLIKDGKEIDISCSIKLWDEIIGKIRKLPINEGENLLYADFNIPKTITDKFSRLGQIMLDDGLAYFNRSKKYGNVDGTLNTWQKSESYAEYGGQSINLDQFWKARDAGKSIEEAAFETFSGKWAKENGFKKVRFEQKNIEQKGVMLNFLK